MMPGERRFDVVVQSPTRVVVIINDFNTKTAVVLSRQEAADLAKVFEQATHEMDHAVLDVKGGIAPMPPRAD